MMQHCRRKNVHRLAIPHREPRGCRMRAILWRIVGSKVARPITNFQHLIAIKGVAAI